MVDARSTMTLFHDEFWKISFGFSCAVGPLTCPVQVLKFSHVQKPHVSDLLA